MYTTQILFKNCIKLLVNGKISAAELPKVSETHKDSLWIINMFHQVLSQVMRSVACTRNTCSRISLYRNCLHIQDLGYSNNSDKDSDISDDCYISNNSNDDSDHSDQNYRKIGITRNKESLEKQEPSEVLELSSEKSELSKFPSPR